jgi:hypothetical protein
MSDIALTGIPRGGTTLACRLLGECRDTVALAEPIEVESLPDDRAGAVSSILRFYAGTRHELQASGRAPGKLVEGRIGDNFFAETGDAQRRAPLVHRGEQRHDPPPRPGFTLAIKHNAGFTALLPELAGSLRTIALVRNPLPVLASWQTVDLPVGAGRIPAGERFDPGLRAQLDAIADCLERQLLVLDWFYRRYAACAHLLKILRYEDIVASGGTGLFDAAGVIGEAQALRDRNASDLYRNSAPARLAEALLAAQGVWRRFYSEDELAASLRKLEEPR